MVVVVEETLGLELSYPSRVDEGITCPWGAHLSTASRLLGEIVFKETSCCRLSQSVVQQQFESKKKKKMSRSC